MTPLCLASTLRQIERVHADLPLMQRAGAAAAEWARQLIGTSPRPILILAGPGNNGGDAFVVASLLRRERYPVEVCFIGRVEALPTDAAAAYRNFVAEGGKTLTDIPQGKEWGLIVDGLFGIGLSRSPEGNYAGWILAANELARDLRCPLLALDCPSGLDAETGRALAPVIEASHTLTFIAGKPGLLTGDGPDYCGQVRIADLDLPGDFAADGHQLGLSAFASHLRPRRNNSHKGSFGSAGLLGGAPSMVGAVFLAARAAIKLGAGRVYLGLLEAAHPGFDPQQPELMLRAPQALLQTSLSALGCGPGMGISLEASERLETALALPLPLVLDADALNLISSERNLQTALAGRSHASILTPHPAEAARLLESSTAEIQADRIAAACELSRRYRAHVALKGCGTVLAIRDGGWWINSTGNPGMATAGMGDVLTGLVTALLAQAWPADKALLAGVHLHGAAADALVASGMGPIGLTAGEVIDAARRLFNDWIQRSGG
ncbi:MAG: NAD(P)H-hydrate dehydratase [Rhodocyclales bacterium GT-UBC]|nr:MAG: NAD(P)H-hydrate dehydratase [Rhodocyclales bacterium GT-UBC]